MQHVEATQYMQNHPRTCWFPLPVHSPDLALVRQSMHLRIHTTFNQLATQLRPGAMFYTDGSCDEPTSPYVARAAWAVVLHQADQHDPAIQTVRITASGHCPGLQTINRAELYAFVIAAEQAIYAQPQALVGICTDSQFVMSIVESIEQDTIHQHPHKRAHWDLIQRLALMWELHSLYALKIKSHQDLNDAKSYEDLWNIYGNASADKAAVQTRQTDLLEFDTLCHEVRKYYIDEKNIHGKKKLAYLLDLALARMSMDESKEKGHKAGRGNTHACPEDHLQAIIATLSHWPLPATLYVQPPEPHKVVFWSSTWGINITRLVANPMAMSLGTSFTR